MQIDGQPYRTVWEAPQGQNIQIIDQRHLPFALVIEDLETVDDVARAIADMHVRGAGCIGATAGYGAYLAACQAYEASDPEEALLQLTDQLLGTRPTAVNLRWAIERQRAALTNLPPADWPSRALATAGAIADEDAAACARIGEHGVALIEELAQTKAPGEAVHILTHCNAGWLAFVDHGSATAPIYAAHDRGLKVHVWVDETRPRNQGARLTAWELGQHGVAHTVIADNAGGHLMQRGEVDLVITGTDRTTRAGDVANKIGTYLKALAAHDNDIPFYVALPSSTFDWDLADGRDIPIEERAPEEVTTLSGRPCAPGEAGTNTDEALIQLCPDTSPAANPAFDITPRHLVTGLITERGICDADEEAIGNLFPEHVPS